MTDLRHSIRRRVMPFTNPAPGAELNIRVPGHEQWVIESLAFRFVADGNAATRVIGLRATENDRPFLHTTPNASQTLGTTLDYSAFSGVGVAQTSAALATIPWPSGGLVLQPGQRLQSLTSAIQVGDQFSLITLLALVFPTGPLVIPTPNVSAVIEPSGDADEGRPLYTFP